MLLRKNCNKLHEDKHTKRQKVNVDIFVQCPVAVMTITQVGFNFSSDPIIDSNMAIWHIYIFKSTSKILLIGGK